MKSFTKFDVKSVWLTESLQNIFVFSQRRVGCEEDTLQNSMRFA